MGQSRHDISAVDFRDVAFPSDRITLGKLREKYRESFDSPLGDLQPEFFWDPDNPRHARKVLGGLLYKERLIVARAFAQATGGSGPWFNKRVVEASLAESYVELGLATGRTHAQELIRDMQRQGAALGGRPGASQISR